MPRPGGSGSREQEPQTPRSEGRAVPAAEGCALDGSGAARSRAGLGHAGAGAGLKAGAGGAASALPEQRNSRCRGAPRAPGLPPVPWIAAGLGHPHGKGSSPGKPAACSREIPCQRTPGHTPGEGLWSPRLSQLTDRDRCVLHVTAAQQGRF